MFSINKYCNGDNVYAVHPFFGIQELESPGTYDTICRQQRFSARRPHITITSTSAVARVKVKANGSKRLGSPDKFPFPSEDIQIRYTYIHTMILYLSTTTIFIVRSTSRCPVTKRFSKSFHDARELERACTVWEISWDSANSSYRPIMLVSLKQNDRSASWKSPTSNSLFLCDNYTKFFCTVLSASRHLACGTPDDMAGSHIVELRSDQPMADAQTQTR